MGDLHKKNAQMRMATMVRVICSDHLRSNLENPFVLAVGGTGLASTTEFMGSGSIFHLSGLPDRSVPGCRSERHGTGDRAIHPASIHSSYTARRSCRGPAPR